MARNRDAEQLFLSRGMRPVRRDGVFLLVDAVQPNEKQTSSGLVLTDHVEDTRRATVIGVGSRIDELAPGDRVLMHKAYGIRIQHGLGAEHKFVLVTGNQIEAKIEDEACLG